MMILVDENIPVITVKALRADDHYVIDARNTPDKGIDDDKLWIK